MTYILVKRRFGELYVRKYDFALFAELFYCVAVELYFFQVKVLIFFERVS
jgi:hypothetical protein